MQLNAIKDFPGVNELHEQNENEGDPCAWKFSRSRTQALREMDKQCFINTTGRALHLTIRGDERPRLFTGGTVH